MQWGLVANNQAVSWDSLQSAVNNGFFLQIGAIPPSGTPLSRCVRKELIQSVIEIEPGPLSGVANNELVVKSQLVGVTYTYYQLTACDGGAGSWTRIFPTLGIGQRYILPSFTNRFFYYNGTSLGPQIPVPSGFNGSIQRVNGSTYCP